MREGRRAGTSVTLIVPGTLRDLAGGSTRLDLGVQVGTVAEALVRLHARAPAIYHRVMNEVGEVRPHVNVFVGPDDIRRLRGLESTVPDGTEITILPAVSGG